MQFYNGIYFVFMNRSITDWAEADANVDKTVITLSRIFRPVLNADLHMRAESNSYAGPP